MDLGTNVGMSVLHWAMHFPNAQVGYIQTHTERQTDRQTGRQADRQADRQTDRQTDRPYYHTSSRHRTGQKAHT